jgi:hypothetical protein
MTNQRNRLPRTKSQQQFLRSLNQEQISGPRLRRFVEEFQSLPKVERDFEGKVIAAIRVFSADPDTGRSALFRMEALAVLVEEGLPGWTSEVRSDGAVMLHPAVLEAAGRAPLHWSGDEVRFSRKSFLRVAFQEAKTNS